MHPKCEKGAKAEAKGRQGEAKGEGRKGVEKQVPKRVRGTPWCWAEMFAVVCMWLRNLGYL